MVCYCNIMVDTGHGRSRFLTQGCAMRNRPEVSKGEVQWQALIVIPTKLAQTTERGGTVISICSGFGLIFTKAWEVDDGC